MRYLLGMRIILVAFSVGSSAYADEGTSDPDFDYLPPDDFGLVEMFSTYARTWLSSPSHAGSFGTAKRRLYNDIGAPASFYCDCDMDLAQRTLDRASCNYVPVNDNARANRIEAEHILPAYWIANFHTGPSCWVKDQVTCGGARECCLENDDRFRRAHNDLVNLTPAIGELNNARSNLTFGLVADEPRLFGQCDFETDRTLRVTEPKEDIRGDIARVYFYMRDTYELAFPEDLIVKLDEWNLADEISAGEIDRNDRIRAIQGTANDLISQ